MAHFEEYHLRNSVSQRELIIAKNTAFFTKNWLICERFPHEM